MRSHARFGLDIWGDDEWRDLDKDAQHLYFVLDTDPNLSFCGSGPWHPARIVARAAGWTVDELWSSACTLASTHDPFLILDLDTEEFLLRSWIKHDELYRMPNMAVSMARARAALASRTLRGVVVHEVSKLRDRYPELTSWSRSEVAKMLEQGAVNPCDNPSVNPWLNPSINPCDNPSATVLPYPSINPSINPSPTPAPAPAPKEQERAHQLRKRPSTPLPEDWKPNDKHRETANTRGLDLDHEAEQFRNHAEANDRRQVSWNAAFAQWLGNAKPRPRVTHARTGRLWQE